MPCGVRCESSGYSLHLSASLSLFHCVPSLVLTRSVLSLTRRSPSTSSCPLSPSRSVVSHTADPAFSLSLCLSVSLSLSLRPSLASCLPPPSITVIIYLSISLSLSDTTLSLSHTHTHSHTQLTHSLSAIILPLTSSPSHSLSFAARVTHSLSHTPSL